MYSQGASQERCDFPAIVVVVVAARTVVAVAVAVTVIRYT